MNAKQFHDLCRRNGACSEGMKWIEGKSLQEFWDTCERGDWMLWLCGKMQGEEGWPTRQAIVLVACDCAELALPHYEKKYPNDKSVRICIEVTRKWAAGEATIEEVRSARNAAAAADAAAYSAYAADDAAAYAAYAADDAAAAAYAADDAAAYAADAAADAAAAAAYAAYAADAAAYAARLRTWKECADICRKRLTIPVEVKA